MLSFIIDSSDSAVTAQLDKANECTNLKTWEKTTTSERILLKQTTF
jgi:hypothetical protein